MRLVRSFVHGLTVYDRPTEIRFDELPPGLIALVGRNGSGKTTAIEAGAPGVLYGNLPSRKKGKSLYDYVTGSTGVIASTFQDGEHEIECRAVLDPTKRKAEYYMTVDGEPVCDGKRGNYAAEVERRFGSLSLLLASVFLAQSKRGAILALDRAERKQLMYELLQLGRFGLLAKAAYWHADAVAKVIAGAESAIAEIHAEVQFDPAALEAAERTLAEAQAQVVTRKQALAALRESIDAQRERRAELRVLESRLGEAAAAVLSARGTVDRLKREQVAAETQATRETAMLHLEAVAKLEQAARDAQASGLGRLDQREIADRALVARESEIRGAQDQVVKLEREQAEISTRNEAWVELQHRKGRLIESRRSAHASLEGAKHALDSRRTELVTQAQAMLEAPCTTSPSWAGITPKAPSVDLAGTCPLLRYARAAKELLDGDPAQDGDYHTRWAAAQDALVEVEKELSDVDRGIGEAAELHEADAVRFVEVTASLLAAKTTAALAVTVGPAKVRLEAVADERRQLEQQYAEEIESALAKVRRAHTDHAAIVARRDEAVERLSAELGKAAEALYEAEHKHGTIETEISTAKAGLGEANDPRFLEAALATDEEAVLAAHGRVTTLRADAERAGQQAGRLEQAREKLGKLQLEHHDWTMLGEACGPNGAPALLLDAAGPEVAAIVNELLLACWSGRFSIEFATLRPLKGKRAGEHAESFEILVYDHGQLRDVEDLSGGEKIVVGTAISFGIAIRHAQKSGIHWETVWADEAAGALDEASAVAYVQMLRRVLAIGGFTQMLLVAHQPVVYEAADERIWFRNGEITVGGEAPWLRVAA